MSIGSGTYVPRGKRMSSVGSAFDEMFFSQEDKALARQIRERMSAGELSVPEAHERIEAIRARYHYSGGEDGSGYRAIARKTPEYVGRYEEAKRQAVQETLERKPFSYDAENDPAYRLAREKYLAAGEQAMDDTVARLSARTGGLASSYAAKAGQDAYLSYAEKAGQLLPQYEERAYRRRLQEDKDKAAAVELLRKLDAEDYARWNDSRETLRQEERNAEERTYRYGKDAADAAYREEKDRAENAYREKEAAYREKKDASEAAYREKKDASEAAYREKKDASEAAYREKRNAEESAYREKKDASEAAYREKRDADTAENQNRQTARQDVQTHLAAGGDWRALPAELLKRAGFSETQMEQLAENYRRTSSSAAKAALQETIYKTGYRPTDAELKAAGMSREEADRWAGAYSETLPQQRASGGTARGGSRRRSSSGRSSAGKTDKPSPQYKNVVKTAKKFNNLGDASAYLNRMLKDGYITDAERRQILSVELGQAVNEPTDAGRFDGALEDISFFLRKGDRKSARAALSRLQSNGMTAEQTKRLQALLKQFGMNA